MTIELWNVYWSPLQADLSIQIFISDNNASLMHRCSDIAGRHAVIPISIWMISERFANLCLTSEVWRWPYWRLQKSARRRCGVSEYVLFDTHYSSFISHCSHHRHILLSHNNAFVYYNLDTWFQINMDRSQWKKSYENRPQSTLPDLTFSQSIRGIFCWYLLKGLMRVFVLSANRYMISQHVQKCWAKRGIEKLQRSGKPDLGHKIGIAVYIS